MQTGACWLSCFLGAATASRVSHFPRSGSVVCTWSCIARLLGGRDVCGLGVGLAASGLAAEKPVHRGSIQLTRSPAPFSLVRFSPEAGSAAQRWACPFRILPCPTGTAHMYRTLVHIFVRVPSSFSKDPSPSYVPISGHRKA